MATPVTEHAYPPLDSQGIHTFITDQGGTLTGDIQTDFRNALFIAVAPGGKANDYSIDDLWQRHIIANVAGDANTVTGNPATAGRGKSGFVGNKLKHYYPPGFLKNPGNANAFPGAGAGNAQSLVFDPGNIYPGVTLSNSDLTMVGGDTGLAQYAACLSATKSRAAGGKWMFEATVDDMSVSGARYASAFCGMGFDDSGGTTPSATYMGSVNGVGSLIDYSGGTLCRVYKGSAANTFIAATTNLYIPADGTVMTMGLDLDAETVSYYINGAPIAVDFGYTVDGAVTDSIYPFVKAFYDVQITLNSTVLYPITGYTVWQ